MRNNKKLECDGNKIWENISGELLRNIFRKRFSVSKEKSKVSGGIGWEGNNCKKCPLLKWVQIVCDLHKIVKFAQKVP